MPLRTQATNNPFLTNYAQGLQQDLQSAVANFIAPVVRVPSTIGQFKKFDDKNAFQVYDTARAIGGAAKRIEFLASDPTYNCQPQALEIAIDDAERAAAGEADPLKLEQAKTRTIVSTAVVSHEDKVLTLIKDSVTATGSRGNWSDTGVDPVAEIDEQIRLIAIATGILPNRLLWGIKAWETFRNHPKVVARQPGAALIGLTTTQSGNMFLNPRIEQQIGVLSKDLAKAGKTRDVTNIVGDEVFIFYASPSPDLYDASFAKTFMGGDGGVDTVRQYREEGSRSDIIALDWSEDIKVVSTLCVKRLTLS